MCGRDRILVLNWTVAVSKVGGVASSDQRNCHHLGTRMGHTVQFSTDSVMIVLPN